MQNNKIYLSFDMSGNFLCRQEDDVKIYAGSVASVEYIIKFSENLSPNDYVYISFTRPDNKKVSPLLCERVLDNTFRHLSTGVELDCELDTVETMLVNISIKGRDILTNIAAVKTQASVDLSIYPSSQFISGTIDEGLTRNFEEHLIGLERNTIKKYNIEELDDLIMPFEADGYKQAPAVYIGYEHEVNYINYNDFATKPKIVKGNLHVFSELKDSVLIQSEYIFANNNIFARTLKIDPLSHDIIDLTEFNDITGGADGKSIHIKYAKNQYGEDAKDLWESGYDFIGVFIGYQPSDNLSDYKWSRFVGEKGETAVDLEQKGFDENGNNIYTMILADGRKFDLLIPRGRDGQSGTVIKVGGVVQDEFDADTKVDKVEGKELSTNDYTIEDKNKLAGIEDGANKTIGLPIGSIIMGAIPLNDASVHLLDGSTISQTGVYEEFCTYLKTLAQTNTSIICTEEQFNTDVLNTGNCGKFVIDDVENTIKLPKITRFVQGLSEINDIGVSLSESLPNITGILSSAGSYGFDAFYNVGGNNAFSGLSSGGWRVTTINEDTQKYHEILFSAHDSNPTYQENSKVQPQATKYPYYIVLANSVKTDVTIDINKYVDDLTKKTDKARTKVIEDKVKVIEDNVGVIEDKTSLLETQDGWTFLNDLPIGVYGGYEIVINDNSNWASQSRSKNFAVTFTNEKQRVYIAHRYNGNNGLSIGNIFTLEQLKATLALGVSIGICTDDSDEYFGISSIVGNTVNLELLSENKAWGIFVVLF